MNKKELKHQHLQAAFEFCSEKFTDSFSSNQQVMLIDKIMEVIEYDHIKIFSGYSKELPLQTLTLIYLISEYKKAYEYSKQEYSSQRKNTLESLGKGFPRKEEEYKKALSSTNDKSLDVNDRASAHFKRLILLPLKSKKYHKVGILMLGLMYNNFPLYKSAFRSYYALNNRIQTLLDTLEYTIKYFEFTYLSPDKIGNSMLITLYTKLLNLGTSEKEAFKWSKEIVSTFLDDQAIPTDKYRLSYLTSNEIYFAGLYNGMPIYQWYTGKKSSYYSDTEVKQFQKYMHIMNKMLVQSQESQIMSNSIFKKMLPNQEVKLDDAICSLINDSERAHHEMLSMHRLFSKSPLRLIEKLSPYKKGYINYIFSALFYTFAKFAELKTIFTRKKLP